MKQRPLDFHDFDEIPKEADRLLDRGYQKVGTWDLAQICNHLAEAMTASISTGVRPMVSLPVRWYIKWRYLGLVLKTRRLKGGVKAPTELRDPPGGDPAVAVKRLRDAAAKVKDYQGRFTAHPYFGRLKREQARQFHLIHCAHHFSYLVPN